MRRHTIVSLLLPILASLGCTEYTEVFGEYEETLAVEDSLTSDPSEVLPGPTRDHSDIEGAGGSGTTPVETGMQCQFPLDDDQVGDAVVTCPTWCTEHIWSSESTEDYRVALDCAGFLCLQDNDAGGPWECFPGSCEKVEGSPLSECEYHRD